MGLPQSGQSSPEVRQWLGNLLVAWTFVTSLAVAFASAWYGRTGDIKILIAYLGAPFLIGVVLFAALGAYALATRSRAPPPPEPVSAGKRRRQQTLMGRAAPPPRTAARDGADGGAAGPDAWERVVVRARADEPELAEYHRALLEPGHARVAVGVLAIAAAIGWAQVVAPAWLRLDPYALAPVALLTAGAALLGALLWRPRRLARRALRRETLLETTWRVGPEGVEVVDARGRDRYAWARIERVREGRVIFLVDTEDGRHLLIPKRAAGPETLARVRAVVRAHAGERAALRAV